MDITSILKININLMICVFDHLITRLIIFCRKMTQSNKVFIQHDSTLIKKSIAIIHNASNVTILVKI